MLYKNLTVIGDDEVLHNYSVDLKQYANMRCDGGCCEYATKPWVLYIPQIDAYYYSVWKCMSTAIREYYHRDFSDRIYPFYTDKPKFTIVRDPYTRMESIYKFRFGSPEIVQQFQDRLYVSFPEFVEMAMAERNHHWIPQTHFVPEYIDYVFKMENLQPLWNFLGAKLPKINQSPNNWPVEWTPATRRLIRDEYAADFERFEYDD